MENNIAQTSLFAFEEIKPKINNKCNLIMKCIVDHGNLTAKQISNLTGIYHPTTVARLNELVYKWQLLKVTNVINNQSVYGLRSASDPINVMSPTPLQRLELLRLWAQGKGLFIPTEEILKKIDEYIK